MGNRTNYGTGRMTVDNRQKNERSRSGNPYSSHVKAGKHAGTVYNFKRKSRIRKSLTRLPILLEFIHKYIFLNFVSFYNGLNSNIQGVIFDWDKIDKDSYLKGIRAFKGVEKLDFNKPITFFVGENGSGKSTLLEALAVAHGFNPEGGTKNYVFSTHDTHSELCDAIRIAKGYRKEKWGYFLRAESFYNVATQEEEYADITHPSAKYHEKSHGESFLALAQNNMNPNGLYLFDEPEAALSPQRQLTLLMQIYRCAKEGAQFIIVTHSPILLGIPDADIYCFDNGRIHLCEYEDTESYQVTEMFINNRQMLLDRLLTD